MTEIGGTTQVFSIRDVKKKMPFLFLTVFLLTAGFLNTFAQTGVRRRVTGNVADSVTGDPLEFVSVALCRSPDSSVATGAITDMNGTFSLEAMTPGNYLLRFSYVGYRTTFLPLHVNSAMVSIKTPVRMVSLSVALKELQITGKVADHKSDIEKVSIRVSQSTAASTGTLLDILKSQPAVNIDQNDQIYLRGNRNILVLLDGKPTSLNAIQSIPAAQVSNIELVTSPDASFDAEGTGGIINIVTKKRSRQGFSLSAELNTGYPGRVNGTIHSLFSNTRWNLGIGYSGRFERQDIASDLNRSYANSDDTLRQEMQTRRTQVVHLISLQAGFTPVQSDIFTFSGKISLPSLRNDQAVESTVYSDTLLPVTANRRNDISWARKMFEGSVKYRHLFAGNRHELSTEVFFSRTKGNRFADYYEEDVFNQKSEGGGAPTNITVQADYFRPVFNRGKMETGLKFFSRGNDFAYHFWDYDTIQGPWTPNPALSNDLEHREYIYSGYGMYSDTLARKLAFKAGIRIEYNTTDLYQHSTGDTISSAYLFPFPYLQLSLPVSAGQSLSLGYTSRITRPTYPQLNPYVNMIDRLTYETGNKELRPELTGKVELGYNYSTKPFRFYGHVYHSLTRHFISAVSFILLPDTLVMTFANGDRMTKWGGGADATIDIGHWASLNGGFACYHGKSSGSFNGISLQSKGFAWNLSLKGSFYPWKNTEIQTTYTYNSPADLPEYYLHQIHSADLRIRQSFLQKKLSVSLTVTDLFDTRRWTIETSNEQFSLWNSSKTDSRIVWLGLTWSLHAQSRQKVSKTTPSEPEEGLIKLGQ